MGMPAVQQLRREYPDIHLTMLVKPGLKAIWKMHPAPDEVLVQGKTAQTIHMLQQSQYDRVYIFPNSFRSAYLPFRAGIPRRIAARGEWRRLMLTEIVHTGSGHQQFEYMSILGLQGDPDTPQIQVPQAALKAVKKQLPRSGARPVITLLPGAARGPAKRWPPESFIALAKTLRSSLNATVVLGGGPDDSEACAKIAAAAGPEVLSLAGKTSIPEWAALLQMSDCVVANDSGGMHLACAVGTPVVGIFGITDPLKTGPLGKNIVLQKSELQSRDIKRNSKEAVRALAAIEPEEVFSAVEQLLADGPTAE